MEVLPRFCKYREDGCEKVFLPGDHHERFCGFRVINCRKDNCGEVQRVQDMYNHYEEYHGFFMASSTEVHKDSFEAVDLDVETNFAFFHEQFVNCQPYYVSIYNNTKEDHVKVSFEGFPVGEPNFDISITFRLIGKGYVLEKTTKPLHLQGDDQKERLLMISEDDSEDFFMKLPHCMWSCFAGNDSSVTTLNIEYTIRCNNSEKLCFRPLFFVPNVLL